MAKLKDLQTTIDLNETQDTELIKDIQANLVRTGYLPNSDEIDGIIGDKTLNAFAKFKKDNFMSDPSLVGEGSAKILLELPDVKQGSGMPTNGNGWISSRFGPRGSGFHRGIDIAASSGTPVYAVAKGKVQNVVSGCTVGNQSCGGGYGNVVYLSHSGQSYDETRYAHLTSVLVSPGQTVTKGQQIGTVGSTGHSTGPHLHFETRINGEAVNPLNHINPIV
jgi:murein DD-endopeptidase MepM/ murein hydrolase activator NlpD